jgi:uncharacterized protein involved in propanediol utilization
MLQKTQISCLGMPPKVHLLVMKSKVVVAVDQLQSLDWLELPQKEVLQVGALLGRQALGGMLHQQWMLAGVWS